MTHKQDKIKDIVNSRTISCHNTNERIIGKIEYIRKFCLRYIPKLDQCMIFCIRF